MKNAYSDVVCVCLLNKRIPDTLQNAYQPKLKYSGPRICVCMALCLCVHACIRFVVLNTFYRKKPKIRVQVSCSEYIMSLSIRRMRLCLGAKRTAIRLHLHIVRQTTYRTHSIICSHSFHPAHHDRTHFHINSSST